MVADVHRIVTQKIFTYAYLACVKSRLSATSQVKQLGVQLIAGCDYSLRDSAWLTASSPTCYETWTLWLINSLQGAASNKNNTSVTWLNRCLLGLPATSTLVLKSAWWCLLRMKSVTVFSLIGLWVVDTLLAYGVRFDSVYGLLFKYTVHCWE